MTLPSQIRVLTPGCHQSSRLNRNTVLAKPLPIGIQRGPDYDRRMSLQPVFRVNGSEKSFGSPMNAECPQHGRR
jgi:hypothetical protein